MRDAEKVGKGNNGLLVLLRRSTCDTLPRPKTRTKSRSGST